ncbi:MAG: M48 family metalloprotease [Bdellovibrionales bacterium]|nr:M48 family metalloprotease [Bdellovibrionales bacterium]
MKSIPLRSTWVLATILTLSAPVARAESFGILIRSEALRATPAPEGAELTSVGSDARVTLLERQGAWWKIRLEDRKEGWVNLFSVRPELKRSPKRVEVKNRSAVMGVRGLDEVALTEAKPDPEQLKLLDSYVATEADLAGFDRLGKERLRAVTTLWRNPPAPAPDQKRKDSTSFERALGDEVAAAILGAAPLSKDADLQRYVNRVGLWVSRQSSRPELPWRFGVIQSDSLNAFAVPGGKILVTEGLYRTLGSEAELAGVLAHEIAHVDERHHYLALIQNKAMQEVQDRLSRVRFAKKALTAMLRSMVSKGAQVFARALDQDLERKADLLGMLMAGDAGYDPYGLPAVMQGLAARSASSFEEEKNELLFRTHPAPEKRLLAFQEFSETRAGAAKGSAFAARLIRVRAKAD